MKFDYIFDEYFTGEVYCKKCKIKVPEESRIYKEWTKYDCFRGDLNCRIPMITYRCPKCKTKETFEDYDAIQETDPNEGMPY